MVVIPFLDQFLYLWGEGQVRVGLGPGAAGQPDGDHRAHALLALYPQGPSVEGDDLVGHRQPDARAPDQLVGLVEFLFHVGQVLGGDAAARVADGDLHIAHGLSGGDGDDASGLGVFQGVVDDVDEHLAQPVPVPVDRGEGGVLLVGELFALGAGPVGEQVHRLVQLG